MRAWLLTGLVVLAGAAIQPTVMAASPWAAEEAAALGVVDAYIAAFNARDPQAFAATLHYPHMRVDGLGRPALWLQPEDVAAGLDVAALEATGWAYSRFDERRVVQSGQEKVHVAVVFTRYRADGTPMHTQDSLYIVTRRDGRWGIQVRSSFLEQVQAEQR
ncbi:MAG: hypothetical protein R3E84_18510 [Pseudomonadales bacterium]|nr:hypothetical protein [Pseudomonadales bacterium]